MAFLDEAGEEAMAWEARAPGVHFVLQLGARGRRWGAVTCCLDGPIGLRDRHRQARRVARGAAGRAQPHAVCRAAVRAGDLDVLVAVSARKDDQSAKVFLQKVAIVGEVNRRISHARPRASLAPTIGATSPAVNCMAR